MKVRTMSSKQVVDKKSVESGVAQAVVLPPTLHKMLTPKWSQKLEEERGISSTLSSVW